MAAAEEARIAEANTSLYRRVINANPWWDNISMPYYAREYRDPGVRDRIRRSGCTTAYSEDLSKSRARQRLSDTCELQQK